ncbi:MAG: DNA polymerase III subunit gamma/tau, partial [Nocardioidaceae bacterium]
IILSQNAQISGFDGTTLTIGLVNAGARDRFVSSGSDEILRQALIDVLGVDWQVEAIVDAGGPTGSASKPGQPSDPSSPPAGSPGRGSDPGTTGGRESASGTSGRSSTNTAADADAHPDDPEAPDADLGHDELLSRELGARMIEEIRHD